MVTIEELKLGNRTLEALKFLLSQITELETAISQINISEIKDANTLTKEQIATLQDVKNAVETINSDLSLKKSEFDEKKQNFDNNMSAFRDDKADFDEKKADFDSKNSTALSNFVFISDNVEKINSVSGLLTEAKNVLETIKLAEQRTQAALNTIANSQAKFDELDALKATLLELKRSLENINTTGLINDTSTSTNTTYSSTKISTLTQGLLRETDASENNTGGKLVKRNAQGNIYATNVYLNAPTKAEVSDIKNSLTTDKWRFIVRDTGEGLLRSMSIKDFISSQEVDAYKKSESDNRYLAKSEASTDNVSDTLVRRGTDKNISVNNIKISDTGSDIEMIRDIERDAQSPYQLLIRKSKDEPIKLMNLQNFIGRLMFYTQGNIDKATNLCLKKTDKIDAYNKKESDDKFALKTSLPGIATETKAGITKIKNIINAKQTDAAVTEKAVSDFLETKINSAITDNYVKLPGGFIVQWGKREAPNNGGKTIFPIAFPNKCLHVMINQYGSDYAQPSNEQYVANKDNAGFNRGMNTWSFYWIAFGY